MAAFCLRETELLKERPESHIRQNPNDTSENWYLVQRPPAVTGRDLRQRHGKNRNTDMPGQWQINFVLSNESREALRSRFHRAKNRGPANGQSSWEHQVYSGSYDSEPQLKDQGTHRRQLQPGIGRTIWPWCAAKPVHCPASI